MPKIVEVPDVGEVEFPDEMNDDQIVQAIRGFSTPSQSAKETPVETVPVEQIWGGIRGDASVLAGQLRPSPDIPGSGVIRGGVSGSEPPAPPEQFDPNNPEHQQAALQSQMAVETLNTMMLPYRTDWFEASTDEERARAAGQAEVDKLETRRALESFTSDQRDPRHPDYGKAVEAARAYTAARDRSEALNARIASVQPAAVAARQAEGEAAATEQKRREFMGETGNFAAFLNQMASYPVNAVGSVLSEFTPSIGDVGGELMRAGSQFKETASRAPGAMGAISRGAGDVAGLVMGNPASRAGAGKWEKLAQNAGVAAAKAGQDAYAQTLVAGGDETQANEVRVKTYQDMLVYMLMGGATSRGVQAALPKGVAPFRAAVLSGTGAAGANVATSMAMAAVKGEEYGLQQLTADVLMGGVEGGQTFSRVKAEQGGPNAQQIRSPSPLDGGVRAPEIAHENVPLPADESGTGVQPGRQGEGVVEPTPETASTEVSNIVPAIRVGGEVLTGNPGETHQDILNRARQANPEREADFLMDFNTKENPNFFVDAAGNEISRAELQEKFGVSDSQGLRELQQTPERRLGPGAANIEEPLAEGFPTSNKEEVVNEERAVQWKDPIVKEASIGNEEAFARARQILEQNPTRGLEIAQRLNSQGPHERTISFEDSAIMIAERVRIKKARAAEIEKSIDPNLSPEEQLTARQRAEEMSTQLESLDSATQGARSTWGRFGQFWQQSVNEDYSFAEMVNTARLKKGEELTPSETQDIKQKSDRFQKAKETFEAKVDEAEVGQPIDEAIRAIEAEASKDPEFEPQVISLAERISNRLQRAADAALKRLRAKGFLQLGSAPDPTIIADLVVYGAAKITKGALDFGRWGTSMIRDLGRGVEPFLKDIWTKANQRVDREAGAGGKNKEKVKEALTKTKTVATVDEIGAGMKSKGGKISEMRGDIQKLVETLVRGGIKQREPLVDTVHEVLKGIDPSITRRQTMDAISGYGDFKPLNKDAVKAEVRDLKQQLQLVAKIQDIQSKIPLQKSGVERQKLSDESRRLTAELNENIKKFGVVLSDPATQLRTILAAQETRLTNRIKDLREEIASGTRRVKSKTDRPSNEKIDALKKELAEVEAEHAALFGKRDITPEQRLKAAVASAKRAEAAENARLEKAKRGVFDKPVKTASAKSAELDAIRARTEAAREERIALEEAANPPLSKAQKALDAAMVARERLDQLLAGEIAPAKKSSPEALTELEADVRAEISAMRELAAEIRRAEKPKTDPEIAKENAQVKALEKAAVEYERRLNEADFSGKGKTQGPDTARVARARALRDAAKAALDAARKLANPPRTKEEIALQKYKTMAARKVADLQERIAKDDFGPRPKRVPLDVSKDPEAVKAKAEMERVKKEFQQKQFEWEQAQRSRTKKFFDGVKETLAASRSLITSADVSAPFRQGGFLLMGDLVFHPVRAAKQIGTMFRQLVSEKGFEEAQAQISLRPNARSGLYDQSGLYLSDLSTKLSAREENMRSNLAERIPIIGRLVRASNRAYAGFLNRQRADSFDAMVESMGGPSKITPDEVKAIANFVNTATGRGTVAQLERAADVAARYFFSPRFLASRFQLVLGQPLATGAAKRVAAQQYAKFAVGLAAVYGLAALSGGKLEKDPRSADFGKAKFGNTRVDPLAGLAQVTTFLSRMITGQTKKGGRIEKRKRSETFTRFARTKLAPIPGVLADFASEQTLDMQKPTVGGSVARLTVPLSYQEAPQVYKEHGFVRGTILEVMNLLGMGVQSYDKR